MKNNKAVDRREWLKKGFFWSVTGTALGALGWIFFDVWFAAGRFSSAHWTAVAPAETLTRESIVPFPEKRVAVIREKQQVAAISLECTHLGCLLNTIDQGFYCPCHGSEFGPRGEVYSGPAKKSLEWHTIRVKHGRLWIHTGQKMAQPQWVSLVQGLASEQQKGA